MQKLTWEQDTVRNAKYCITEVTNRYRQWIISKLAEQPGEYSLHIQESLYTRIYNTSTQLTFHSVPATMD